LRPARSIAERNEPGGHFWRTRWTPCTRNEGRLSRWGEALAHPRVNDIVRWLSARNITMRLNTNGVLVRRRVDVVRRMEKLKISLDGPPEIHEAIRGSSAGKPALTNRTESSEDRHVDVPASALLLRTRC